MAVVVDGIAQIVLAILVLMAFAYSSTALERALPRAANVSAWLFAALVLVMFVIVIGWFIVFEIWWSGRTPGKRALGLRVVRDGGFPLDAGAAVVRNLVRLIELGLGFYTISAISALISKENKRLGDFAAGTIVVRDRAAAVPDLDAYLARPSRNDIGLSEPDRLLVERFLARRTTLDPSARVQLAGRIADRIRPTLVASYTNLDDEDLLEYVTGK